MQQPKLGGSTLKVDKASADAVDYGDVRNVRAALGGSAVRIALTTTIGVTNRTSSYNQTTEAHDWKRRSFLFDITRDVQRQSAGAQAGNV
jgi:hypothetical protein